MKSAHILLTAALALAPAGLFAEVTLQDFGNDVLRRRKDLGLRDEDVARFGEVARQVDPSYEIPPESVQKKSSLDEGSGRGAMERLRRAASEQGVPPPAEVAVPPESALTFVEPDGTRKPYESERELELRLRAMSGSRVVGAAQPAVYQFLRAMHEKSLEAIPDAHDRRYVERMKRELDPQVMGASFPTVVWGRMPAPNVIATYSGNVVTVGELFSSLPLSFQAIVIAHEYAHWQDDGQDRNAIGHNKFGADSAPGIQNPAERWAYYIMRAGRRGPRL